MKTCKQPFAQTREYLIGYARLPKKEHISSISRQKEPENEISHVQDQGVAAQTIGNACEYPFCV